MNRRLYPDDLDSSPYKELMQGLAFRWVRAELPAEGLTYTDYLTDIRILLLTTQDPDRTTVIVQAVLDQAVALRKSSVWVDQELKFEGMIEGADRVDFLRLDLQQTGTIDDAMLDTYNERMNRFLINRE